MARVRGYVREAFQLLSPERDVQPGSSVFILPAMGLSRRIAERNRHAGADF